MDKKHRIFKKTIVPILFDFYIAGSKHFNGRPQEEISLQEVIDFIKQWMEKHFK